MSDEKFSEMSDEEFEEYLKEKYGPKWILISLTDEEYDRVSVDVEKIKEALRKGMEEARKAWENRSCIGVDPRLRFR